MKKILLLLFLLPGMNYGQISDSFTDGNFTENPVWWGDQSHFEINSLLQLHLKSSGTDTSVLFTRSRRIQETEWSWWMKLSFNTSVNNFSRIYITADTNVAGRIRQSLYLQAGGSDDSIAVYRQHENDHEKIAGIRCYLTNKSTNNLRIKILHGADDGWEVWMDTTGGNGCFRAGTFSDSTVNECGWFGFFCKYTSSNATKFYFDDVYAGPIRRDSIAPRVISQRFGDDHWLELEFSEPPDPFTACRTGNYKSILSGRSPDSATSQASDPGRIRLFFNPPIPESSCDTLRISAIADPAGNVMAETLAGYCHYHPRPYDIVIHEILADPDPVTELPDAEFVELFNKTGFPVSLKNWIFSFGSYRKTFSDVTISGRSFMILAKDSVYQHYGQCSLLFTSSSSLSNEGTVLVLKDPEQRVIHAVSYTSDWFQGSFKGEGGWSLEMRDPWNPCGCAENWAPSVHPLGGTPGAANSVQKENADLAPPEPLHAAINGSDRVELTLSEPADSLSLLDPEAYLLQPGALKPDSIFPVAPQYQSVVLRFPVTFDTGIVYRLKTGNLRDCSGNRSEQGRETRFAIPGTARSHDLVINEFLSDPQKGGKRFVELFNRSEKVIDLKTLLFSGTDTVSGMPVEAVELSKKSYLLFPGEYVVLTSDASDIRARYWCPQPGCFREVTGFPAFGSDSGTLVVARRDFPEVIDRVRYRPGLHYPLLSSREGVALERLLPDWPSDLSSNWHSAAETSGFATPGYTNSHAFVSPDNGAVLEIQPAIFSPDNDGYDDLLSIAVNGNVPDVAVSVTVYDIRGRLVRELVNNVLSETNSVFVWDGITSVGRKAPAGYYIIMAELVNPGGQVQRIKKTAVLGGRF